MTQPQTQPQTQTAPPNASSNAARPFTKVLINILLPSAEEAMILAELGVRIDVRSADEVAANNMRLDALARANGFTPVVRKSGGHKLTDAGRTKLFQHASLGAMLGDFLDAGYTNVDTFLLNKGGQGRTDARWFLRILYVPSGEGVEQIVLSKGARKVVGEDHLFGRGYEKVHLYDNFATDGSATVNAVRFMSVRRTPPLRMTVEGEFYQDS